MEELPIHPELDNLFEIQNYDSRLRERNLEIKSRWAESSESFPPVGIRGSGIEMTLLAEYLRMFWPQMRSRGFSENDFKNYWSWLDEKLRDPGAPHEQLLNFCLRFFERWESLCKKKTSKINLKFLKKLTSEIWLS